MSQALPDYAKITRGPQSQGTCKHGSRPGPPSPLAAGAGSDPQASAHGVESEDTWLEEKLLDRKVLQSAGFSKHVGQLLTQSSCDS